MKTKKVMVACRLPVEIHKKLKEIAERKYCSITYLIIEMVLKEESEYKKKEVTNEKYSLAGNQEI